MLLKFSHLFRMATDPVLRYTPNQLAVCKFRVACSEDRDDKNKRLFLNGTAFRKVAENLATVKKGQFIFIHGRLETDEYLDKKAQSKRNETVMVVESIEFVTPKSKPIAAPSKAPEP